MSYQEQKVSVILTRGQIETLLIYTDNDSTEDAELYNILREAIDYDATERNDLNE